jgi:glycosyltransferase involved in cell wall biosynthesis
LSETSSSVLASDGSAVSGLRVAPRLKTGVIINTFEDEHGTAGGIVHIFESIKRWRRSDVTVFGPEIARARVKAELPDVQFVSIPSADRWVRNIVLLFGLRIITGLLTTPWKLREFDAVYVLSHFLPDVVPAVCAAPNRMVVQVFHLQKPPGERPGSFLRNLVAYTNESIGMALVRRFARSIVVLNDVSICELNLPATTRVFRVGAGAWPMPVDDMIQPTDSRSGVVSVGRIHPTKGIDDLVDAWAVVHARLPGVCLTLVGTGDPAHVQAVRQRIAERELESCVHFAGFVSEEQKARIVSGARVFVSASKEEGWGIAIAEALALGVPCVTYDLPVFAEAFPTGRLEVRTGDVAGLAKAIVTLLTDDTCYGSLAAQARQCGASFSWESVARIEEEAVASVAQGASKH